MAELIKTNLFSFLTYKTGNAANFKLYADTLILRIKIHQVKTGGDIIIRQNASRFEKPSVEGIEAEKQVLLGRISSQVAQFSVPISVARL